MVPRIPHKIPPPKILGVRDPLLPYIAIEKPCDLNKIEGMISTATSFDYEAFAPQAWPERRLQHSSALDQPMRPFLKWVGGKRGLLDQLEPFLPIRFGAYHEPFLGSAAMFFAVRPRRASLSDLNAHLVNLYEVVRDHPIGLLRDLNRLARAHSPDQYYQVRTSFNEEPDARPILRAARFLYLNKTCFNGLWRVNRSGMFNVPAGRYTNPTISNPPLIRAASEALAGTKIRHCTYDEALSNVKPGDFVYLDPPYVPLNPTSNFTSYHAEGFTDADQGLLRDMFAELDARGAQVMLSNSDSELVWDLYQGFRIDQVWARRSINSKAQNRGPITEVVVRNFYLDRAGVARVAALRERRGLIRGANGQVMTVETRTRNEQRQGKH